MATRATLGIRVVPQGCSEDRAGRGTQRAGDNARTIDASQDPLRAYLAAVRSVPLLTASQERSLCGELEAAQRALDAALAAGARRPDVERHAGRVRALRDQLIVANLRLVIAMARRYRHSGLPLEDLVQEGNLGLMKAVDRFDPGRGFRFSTYATWWIRQAMSAAVARTARTIRLPPNVLAALRRIGALRAALVVELGRFPTSAEVAARAGLPLPRVEELLLAADVPAAIGDPLAGSAVHADRFVDCARLDPEARAVAAGERRALADAFATLDTRERAVLALRFGLAGGREHTLAEVGRRLGITRKRARLIEVRALHRLRLRTGAARSRPAA